MSKSNIQALVTGQFNSLNAKDNKERLRYTVAGCKDGKLYDHVGTDYGTFDEDAPDTEFITEDDLNSTRITAVRLQNITQRMQNFFNTYGANPVVVEDEAEVDDEKPTPVSEQPSNEDALIEKFKKAVKKGKAKKARKLLDEIGENKKLAKMLKKLEAEG